MLFFIPKKNAVQLSLCSGPVREARGHGMAQILNQTCPVQQGHVAPPANTEREPATRLYHAHTRSLEEG